MRYQINNNGNNKQDIALRALKVSKAFNDLNEAIASFQSETCHGRNYQTLDNPEHERQSDLRHLRSLQGGILSMADTFRSTWKGQS